MSAVLVPVWRRIQLLIQSHSTALVIMTLSAVALNALLLAGRSGAWLDSVGSSLMFLSVAFAVILTSGIVARDFTSGAVQLWLQKPVDPVVFYLGRFAEAVAAWSVLTLLLVAATRIEIWWLGWSARADLLVALPRIWLASFVVAAIAFGLSPWLTRGGVVGTLVIVLGGMILEEELAVRLDVLGPTWTPFVRATSFPETALAQITDFAIGESNTLWIPLMRILAYASAWIIIGGLGVRRAIRNGGLARAQGG